MGLEEILYLRFANVDARAGLEPQLPRAAFRSPWARSSASRTAGTSTTPSAPCATSSSTICSSCSRRPRWSRRPGGNPESLQGCQARLFLARWPTPIPPITCAVKYDGYRSIDGVAADSDTETYAALRLEIDNWRWAESPSSSAPASACAPREHRAAARVQAPAAGRIACRRPRDCTPSQIVFKIDPSTGIRVILDAHRADRQGPTEIELDMEFAEEGGEDATSYEVLMNAALMGELRHFTRQDNVEATWRVVQPLLDAPPHRALGTPGSWRPARAICSSHFGGWRGPWISRD